MPRPQIPARVYVSAVILAGTVLLVEGFPHSIARPVLCLALGLLSVLASTLKVSLPLSAGSATMSVSYVVDLMTLILVGPRIAMVTAAVGAWAQCVSRKRPTGVSRTLFSMAALVLSVRASGAAYEWLGGVPGALSWTMAGKPLLAAVAVYYLANTVLVAVAIGVTSDDNPYTVWRQTFLWSAPSYLVGGGVAAVGAWLVESGGIWFTPLAVAPGYLTYRTHRLYLDRLADERRHVEEISALHEQAVEALKLAESSQQALATEKERLTVTLRSLGEAVITTDLGGTIVLLNHAAEVLTGCDSQAAIGRSLPDVVRLVDVRTARPCESPLEAMLRLQGPLEPRGRVVLVAGDGSERLVEHTGMPLRNNDGAIEGMVLVVRDVSDIVRLEQERQKADRLESLGILAGGIAHDFNNILTAIVGNVSIARADTTLDPDTAGHLREAEQACVRAKTLTHQLLTFSKGGAPVKKTACLNDLVREAARFALRGTSVRCEFALAADLWAVEADEGQMLQVVNNLVINAQQAMPLGGTIRVGTENLPRRQEATGEEACDRIRITVQDGGVGIPEENLERIFDPYFTTKRMGSGLGLATVYSIIRNHGGRIDVRSVVNEGTTMAILLPAHPDRVPVPRTTAPVAQAGRGRVLVMDDEEALRKLARAMLRRLGYDAEVAEDGSQAIEMYRKAMEDERPFDAVVMDLTVPGGLGGKEAIKDLLLINPGVRAIVSSGYADDPVMADFRAYGFMAVVPKPFGYAELSTALQQVLN